MELRCPSRMHGVVQDGRMEVVCHSKHCGNEAGVTVFHYFDLLSGTLIETKRFRTPTIHSKKKERA